LLSDNNETKLSLGSGIVKTTSDNDALACELFIDFLDVKDLLGEPQLWITL
jgi:hypothetical protein